MRNFILLILVIIFSTLSNFLYSKDNYFYVGGGFGTFLGNVNQSWDYQGQHNDTTYYLNNSINAFGGYNFTKWFALEGEVNYGFPNKETFSCETGCDTFTTKYGLYNINVNTVFKYEINHKNIPFIKLGLGYYQFPEDSQSAYGLGVVLGIGYEYAITKNHSVIISYDYNYTFDNDQYLDHGDVFRGDYTYNMSYSEVKLQYKYSFR